MDLDYFVNGFYLKHYKEYDPNLNELDSYSIDSENNLVIHHHTKHGKSLTSVFSIWEVMATMCD